MEKYGKILSGTLLVLLAIGGNISKGTDRCPAPVIRDYHIFMGHLHNHTAISDGKGTPAQAYRYARDTAGLDFLGIADHADSIEATEWTELKQAAAQYNQAGVFVTFWGFEWSSE